MGSNRTMYRSIKNDASFGHESLGCRVICVYKGVKGEQIHEKTHKGRNVVFVTHSIISKIEL